MLEAKAFTIPGIEEDGGLVNVLVRYTPRSPEEEVVATSFERPRAKLSLLLLHSISSHKEAWLPMVEHLFELQRTAPTNAFDVVEAWAMDLPNHGRAAVINERRLAAYGRIISGWQAARAIHVFLKSGLVAPGAAIVAVGHSASTCILVQCTEGFPVSALPFSSLVMVDPPMMAGEMLAKARAEGWPLVRAIDVAKKRKDVWSSRAEAKEWFAERWPWRRWDPRVLDLYVEHALCDLPTAAYPDLKEGVTLSITRDHEVAGYSGYDDADAGLARLKTLCPAMPVHCVFGGQPDLLPLEAQNALVDEKEGRRMRSIVRVARAGHLVVQENPRDLALALWGILHEDYGVLAVAAARL